MHANTSSKKIIEKRKQQNNFPGKKRKNDIGGKKEKVSLTSSVSENFGKHSP